MNKEQKITLFGYSFIHGLIDLCCAMLVLSSLLFNHFTLQDSFICVVIYNVVAFGLQAPLGVLVDKLQAPKKSALMGCFLVLISFFFFNNPILLVLLSGLGNALFHVGGGSISLNFNPIKATAPGIFVGPGALGLTIGVLIGKSGVLIMWPFVILLILSCIFIYFRNIPEINYKKELVKQKINCFELVLLLILLSVSIRALYGSVAIFAWKADIILLILLTLAVVAGKMLGGFIADNFGWIKTAIFALIISAPLLAFFQDSPFLIIIAIFLFQITMPITVTALSNMLPGRSATAFGLTVFALLLGILPSYLGLDFFNEQWVYLLIIILSASSLLVSFKFLYNYFKKEKKINL
jgi:FSR family fosmidomycin resistance protein-like MFS transporter